jgi:cytochrome P450 family 2 subfamily U polypeptide 1
MEETNRIIQLGSNPGYAFPPLRFVPGLCEFDAINNCATHIHKLFKDIMTERRVHGNFRRTQNDFIDYFLQMIDQESGDKNSIYHDEQFLQCGTDLLIAGIDTTSNSIEFTLLYLLKYPKVQEKLRAEIDEVIGRNRPPSVFDKPNMPYAEAVCLEVLRNANIIPINTRVSVNETKLNGYDVPAQSLGLINLLMIHKNKKLWGDPDVFRPERFLDENMNLINKEKVFAFGGGKRVCIGLTMAKLTWFTFITTLLQRYTFEPSPTFPELSLNPDSGFANMPHTFNCVVKLRPTMSEDMAKCT